MSDYEIIDPRFKKLIVGNASVEKIADGCRWAEGPVWFGDGGYLLWSDIPNNRMLRWFLNGNVDTYRTDSENSNGNTRDREGRLVSCLHGSRKVIRTELDGSITTIADNYKGGKLNSPNDVVVKSDGTIWFTDPPYGIMSDYEGYKSDMEQDGCYVYRVSADLSEITIVCDDFVKPNGLAFSPDETKFYVADSAFSHDPDAPHHIREFDVDADGNLSGGAVFADVTPGLPDGFRFDTNGNLWTSAKDGVHCYTPDGTLIGKILIPETVANLTFGGPKRNRMFITATSSVYSVYLNANGAQRP